MLANRQALLREKDIEIGNLNLQLSLKDQLILKKEEDLKTVNLNLDKEKRNHKWTKFGWGGTTVLLGALLTIVAIR